MDGFDAEDLVNVTTTVVDGVVVTRAAGEIDISSVDLVREELAKQLDRHPVSLVLDLGALTFIGSTGINMLIEEQLRVQELGTAFVVVADQSVVLKPLEIAGVLDVLVVCPSVPEAIRLLQGHPASE
ncbi:STAS domain-containing protein [Lentzea sp. E54]|uniref:STAS domain-containing protein n=1 Tax=Lentzea xerophila TaxID=3435883 RepID=UPI003DA5AA26